MNRAKFFAALRARDSGVFGTSLTQQQVDGIEALLDACTRHGVVGSHHVANVLAQVYRETGGRMAPVRETFASSDAQAISRLETAWKAGKLKGVKTPYWRDGWYGRGPIQITHRDNYAKFEKRLGVPLTRNRELAMDPKIGADIAVVGMSEGLFRSRKLADYKFPAALDAPPASNPRRIVNGNDGSDKEVARFHCAFHAALLKAGYSAVQAIKDARPAAPATQTPASPQPAPARPAGDEREFSIIAAIAAVVATVGGTILLYFFGG